MVCRWAAAYGVSADVVACEDSTVTYVPVHDIQASTPSLLTHPTCQATHTTHESGIQIRTASTHTGKCTSASIALTGSMYMCQHVEGIYTGTFSLTASSTGHHPPAGVRGYPVACCRCPPPPPDPGP